MKNAIIIVVILLLVLLVYLYVRAKFIWSKLSFGVEIKKIDLSDIEQIGVKINLIIRNDSDFSIELKNVRATVKDESKKLIAYSDKVKKVEILPYKAMKVPLLANINTVEMLGLISKTKLYLKYTIKASVWKVPLTYSEKIEKE